MPSATDITKVCATCGEAKPLDAFHRCSAFADGRYNRCGACRNASRRRDTPRAAAIREQRALRAEGRKRCHRCHEVKVLDEFYVNTACHDGYASACSDCAKREAAERQKRNRVAYNARHKRWRHANLKGYREKGDHIVPLAEGGEHSYANVQVAHVFCNRSKGGRLGAAITNAKEAMA